MFVDPKHIIFALLCLRALIAVYSSVTKAARVPGILFAAILIPIPVVQISIPSWPSCLLIFSATSFAKSG